jgi:hypothetical protein
MFGQFDPLSLIFYIIIFASIFFLPKLMVYQIISLLEAKARSYEEMTEKSQKLILKKIDKKTKLSKKEMDSSISRIMDYFVVPPDTTETQGLAKKVRDLTRRHDKKLDIFVEDITHGMDKIDQKNVAAGLMHTIGIYQVSKIIRHFIELIKETKNFTIGMQLQIMLPFIDKQVKALYASVPAFLDRLPVGDCIGPLYAATLIGDTKTENISEGTVVAKKKINGSDAYILKADGPAANLGEIDQAVRKIVSKEKIAKVITVDASGKLEGEKTGSVAEGIGFAMGPRGAEKFFVESFLIDKGVSVDAIIVKMKSEEALMPMPKDVLKALPAIDEAVKRSIKEAKGKVIIAGIGVTAGVGNSKEAAEEAKKAVERYHKKLDAKKKEEERKNRGFFEKIFGK